MAHTELNNLIWENNSLKEDVRAGILNLVDYFLKDNQAPIDVFDIRIVGSNASFNYTETSDIDIHIVDKTENKSKMALYMQWREARDFNDNYSIKIKGLDAEIYIEDINQPAKSNGVYSVLDNVWLKFPTHTPERDKIDVGKEVDAWSKRIRELEENGTEAEIERVRSNLVAMRKNSIAEDGEYGKGNLIFKELRRNGMIDRLTKAKKGAVSKELSVEELEESLLLEDRRQDLINKSKSSAKGMQRYNRRQKSKVANTVRQFNSMDMNKLFKDGIMTVNIDVVGETDNYVVKVTFKNFLTLLRREMQRNNNIFDLRSVTRALVNGFNEEDVYVFCSCKDFYYRYSYQATKNKYNSGKPQMIPAPITNPDDSIGSGCKHILLVLNNNGWLIKCASVIKNYVRYMEQHYQRMYADIIYPAIYNKKYEKEVQLQIDDSDTLAGEEDRDTLNKANEYAKKSTQFQKGNQLGYKFVSNKENDIEQQSLDLD